MSDKVYLDVCYFCRESKAAIKYSQSTGDPIFCAEVDYFGECQWERDRHRFVVTTDILEAEKRDEEECLRQMSDMADWFDRNPMETNA